MGHGGTLDPLATGVLILGVGSGTKALNGFLQCTKSYETVVLFGAATDSYDTEGKVVARQPYEHVTREKVEQALAKFRGEIMQRPPIFSALRVQGKRLYEYAREGKEVPVEIQERPVKVEELEVIEWYEGGTHEWKWPEKDAEAEEKVVVERVLHLGGDRSGGDVQIEEVTAGTKRKRETDDEPDTKRTKPSPEPVASGSLPNTTTDNDTAVAPPPPNVEITTSQSIPTSTDSPCPAPAVRLRMTVTSGFYVRSLAHDLGAALGSLGIMASLVRTRQGDFALGTNVLWYEDLAKGEEVWGPKVGGMLGEWAEKEKETQGGSEVVGQGKGSGSGGSKDGESGGVKAVETEPMREAKPAARARVRRNTSSEDD